MTGFTAEIQTEHLRSMSAVCYWYANLLVGMLFILS
jgi:hypothetical protein